MTMRELLLTQPDQYGDFWIKNEIFYTMRDMEVIASTLMSINLSSILSTSIKRVSITRGSKLVFQHLNTGGDKDYAGFVDLHTVRCKSFYLKKSGVYGFDLTRGELKCTLFTRTKETFVKWKGYFEYYTIQQGKIDNLPFINFSFFEEYFTHKC